MKKVRIIEETDYDVIYLDNYEEYLNLPKFKWYDYLFPIRILSSTLFGFFYFLFFSKIEKPKEKKIHPPKIIIEVSKPRRAILKSEIRVSRGSSMPDVAEFKILPSVKKAVLIKDFGNEEIMSKREEVGIKGYWKYYHSWYEFDYHKFMEKVKPKLKQLGISEKELFKAISELIKRKGVK